MEVVVISSGIYHIGCTTDDRFANPHELPRRKISIDRFAIGKHPVTVGEFARFSKIQSKETPQLPVVDVSWVEAMSYCDWLTDQTGETFRLPTEAEWEFACRAGTETPFPSGYLPDPEQVNLLYDENGRRVGIGHRLECGWGKPNALGVYDMLGNVFEWTMDDWANNYKDLLPNGAAQCSDSGKKVIRGGGWDAMPRLARASYRDSAPPITKQDNLGFRVVKDL